MKLPKKRYIIIVLILLVVIFRGWIYRNSITYTKVGQRESFSIMNLDLKNKINNIIEGKEMSLEEIIDVSEELTADILQFTSEKASRNPNSTYKTGKANCIGYSAMFNSICKYIIKEKGYKNKYQSNHFKGKLYFFGFNIHKLFDSAFFANHDYNEIKDLATGEKFYVDPSLNDYLKIDRVNAKN